METTAERVEKWALDVWDLGIRVLGSGFCGYCLGMLARVQRIDLVP